MSVIKISELNPIPSQPTVDDFFPMVDSASLTTYRVSISQLAPVLTSSMYVSGSNTSISSSWASRSLSASHALQADNGYLQGASGYVPYYSASAAWTYGGTNSGLAYSSPLQVSYSAFAWNGIVGINQGSLTTGYYSTESGYFWRTDYSQSYWYRPEAHTPFGGGYYSISGLSVGAPIIGTFIGTDQVMYHISTASVAGYSTSNVPYTNLVWSGSSASGSYKTISNIAGNTVSESFNGKWVRVACTSNWGGNIISPSAAKGETAQGQSTGTANGFFGRVIFVLSTTQDPGSNVNQMIDMTINNQQYGNGLTANVDWAGVYQTDIIKKIRLSVHTPYSGSPDYFPGTTSSIDPINAIDLYIDDLNENDYHFSLGCYSWGGIKFLDQLNLEPPVLVNTGSKGNSGPYKATYVVFPPEPGFYTSLNKDSRNYNIHGLPVTIWPTRNEITRSAADVVAYRNLYSLNVSGTINATEKYYCSGSEGQDGTFTQYSASQWSTCVYKGGILVTNTGGAGSPTFTHAATSSWSSSSLSSSYISASVRSHPGIPVAWAMCVSTASTGATSHTASVDWHYLNVYPAFNVRSVTKDDGTGTFPPGFPVGGGTPVKSTRSGGDIYYGASADKHWIVTLNTSMSSTNYMVMGAAGGQNGGAPAGHCTVTMFPEGKRTTTAFTLSMAQSSGMTYNDVNQIAWFNFAVYENPLDIGLTIPNYPT